MPRLGLQAASLPESKEQGWEDLAYEGGGLQATAGVQEPRSGNRAHAVPRSRGRAGLGAESRDKGRARARGGARRRAPPPRQARPPRPFLAALKVPGRGARKRRKKCRRPGGSQGAAAPPPTWNRTCASGSPNAKYGPGPAQLGAGRARAARPGVAAGRRDLEQATWSQHPPSPFRPRGGEGKARLAGCRRHPDCEITGCGKPRLQAVARRRCPIEIGWSHVGNSKFSSSHIKNIYMTFYLVISIIYCI